MKTIITLGLVTVLVASCAQIRPDKFNRVYTKRSQLKELESRSYHALSDPSDSISGYTMQTEEQYQRMDVEYWRTHWSEADKKEFVNNYVYEYVVYKGDTIR